MFDCRCVFDVKYNADGSVDRFRARRVAPGDTERSAIEYQEVFAAVDKYGSLRLLLALSTILGLPSPSPN